MLNQQSKESAGTDTMNKSQKSSLRAVKEEGQHLVEEFRGAANDVTEQVSKTAKQVVEWTRENPVQAVLMGVGVGFFLGAIIRRALGIRRPGLFSALKR